jgi:hypothetical protein
MVYWTLEEIKELAIKYRFEIIHFPKDMNDQFFLFKKTYA